ncbi:A/G-specific adenine glycosylase [Aliikangiella sp. IMCC44653]
MLISPKLFAQKILKFYHAHGRKDLPWQKNPTPYRVWVSEVMLQQTQVKTVIPYYLKFMQRFPDVEALASAELDDVLHFWQGLGYYSRARNLHRCAQQVVAQFKGQFPLTLEQMQALPGIGRSTAGAVLSLANNLPTPILDGNVKRVLARVFLVDGWYGQAAVAKELWRLSETYTPRQQTAAFNQAMMDLGASFCSRTKPNCEACPLATHCLAFIHNKTAEYPHKKPKKTIPTRHTSLLLNLNKRHQVLLNKNPPSGIWGGLWSLPKLTESQQQATQLQLVDEFRHTFTHFHLEISIFSGSLKKTDTIQENHELAWHNINTLKDLAFPTPIRKFLNRYFQSL